MDVFVAQVINGLAIGSIYSLIVVGINLIILVKGVVHFAYIHIMVLCMFITWMVLQQTNNNFALAAMAGIVAAIVLVVATEPLFRPLAKRKAFLESLILGMGISIIITEVMSHQIHNGLPVSFPSSIVGGGAYFQAGPIFFSLAHVYTILGTIVAVILLFYFLYRHKEGRAMRAVAQDVSKSRLLGVPLNKAGIYSFAIGGLLAGVTAVFMAMTLGSASATLGDSLAIKAIIVALFAGMGNLKGGVICALLIGVAEALVAAYLPGRWTEAIVFGAVMIVIITRPRGVFGTQA
ncbi:MAG: branched-chain amino acid ABC transporter permease [Dehalococcoidia bacterium]|jgi:branched-chain amino acid transport system permease protein